MKRFILGLAMAGMVLAAAAPSATAGDRFARRTVYRGHHAHVHRHYGNVHSVHRLNTYQRRTVGYSGYRSPYSCYGPVPVYRPAYGAYPVYGSGFGYSSGRVNLWVGF